jgi:ankyrin repeat protein
MLLSVNVNLNVKDQQGNTALLEAARNGQEEIITLLMSRGARLNMDSLLPVWAGAAPGGGRGGGKRCCSGFACGVEAVCPPCSSARGQQGCTGAQSQGQPQQIPGGRGAMVRRRSSRC